MTTPIEPMTFKDTMYLVGLLFTGATALLGVWWRIELRIREVERKASHDIRNTEAVAQAGRALIGKDLSDFKLEVAKEYAAKETVRDLEDKIESRLESLAEKVDGMPDMIVERITKFLSLSK